MSPAELTHQQSVLCPHCGEAVPLTEALTHPIQERLRKELAAEMERRERQYAAAVDKLRKEYDDRAAADRAEMEKAIRKRAAESVSHELADLKNQLQEKTGQLDDARKRDLEIRKRERDLAERERSLQAEAERTLDREREKIRSDAAAKATEMIQREAGELRAQLAERTRKLDEAQRQEMELRKRQRELEDRERSLALELERKLDAERIKIREDAAQKAAEEHRLREREKDKQLDDMRRQIEDLKRKAEQGSQQLQGEAQELALEDALRAAFPFDEIGPVPKGVRGGDVIQTVVSASGGRCGTILWESKRTKAWSDGWVAKLKDDQRAVKADVAILVTTHLPKDLRHVGWQDGVWVSDFPSMLGFASALRSGILQVARAKSALEGRGEKMELIYRYLSGPEFRHRLEAIVESFQTLKGDLDAERRAMERIWAKREKQIERVSLSTAGLYGDLQGLIGSSLSSIGRLELASDESEGEEPESPPNDELRFG